MATKISTSKRGVTSGKETDEDLNRMEHDIRKLKIEYEQYFGGGKTRPPSEVEWRIEQIIKRYGDRGAEMNFGQRFRYGNLAQTFAKYKDIFHKRAKKREEGTVDRHFGAAARQIEAERARRRKAPMAPVAVRCSDPAQEPKKVEQIYKAFQEALERSGQPTEQMSRQAFEDFLQRKVEQLRPHKHGPEVEVIVSLDGGKASLKARVKT